MEKKTLRKPVPRDELGDLKLSSNRTPEESINYQRRWSAIYVFKEFDQKRDFYWPCFDLFEDLDNRLEQARQHRDFYEVNLFPIASNSDLQHLSFQKLDWCRGAFFHFFKEAFEISDHFQGLHWNFDYSRIILPKSKYYELMQVLNKHDILHLRDLILFIIAKTQDYYIHEVEFWERKEQKKMVKDNERDVTQIIKMIEKVSDDSWHRNHKAKTPTDIKQITFAFPDDTFKITDYWLCNEFIQHFKSHYDEGAYKNWKLQLEKAQAFHREYTEKKNFKFLLARALYNFFTETRSFVLEEGHPTPNPIMDCIAHIMELGLINIKTSTGKFSGKIRTIRNWVKLHSIEQTPTTIRIEPDRVKLYKYFDKEFIDSEGEIKKANAISDGAFICKRFDLWKLDKEIIHIMACLHQWRWRIGSQLSNGAIIPENNKLPNQYAALNLLIKALKDRKRIAKFSFQLTGDKKRHELSDLLPAELIESAIIQYYQDFNEEFEIDILQSEIKNVGSPGSGSFTIKTTGEFTPLEARFLPRFVSSFYDFLLHEAAPADNEFNPSEKYYLIIAKALELALYFQQPIPDPFPDERLLKAKVKRYHSMSRKQKM